MPTVALDILIDGSKSLPGATAVDAELKKIGATAVQTQAQVAGVFGSAAGGGTLPQGLANTSRTMGQLNQSFGATRSLLIQTSSAFGQFGGAAGAAGQAVGLLASAWKAGPFGIAAAVITGAAGALTLFGGSARKATEDFEALGQSIEKAMLNARAGASLGIKSTDDLVRNAQINASQGLLSGSLGGQQLTIDDLASLVGGRANAARLLNAQGNTSAGQYVRSGSFDLQVTRSGQFLGGTSFDRVDDLSRLPFTQEQARGAIRQFGSSLVTQRDAEVAARGGGSGGTESWRGPLGYGSPSPFSDRNPFYLSGGPNYVEQSAEDRAKVTLDAQREAAKEAQRNMDELIAKGEQFGASIGDAFFDAASGAQSLRQALNQLLQDFARSSMREVFSGIFKNALGGVFGQTNTQAKEDGG